MNWSGGCPLYNSCALYKNPILGRGEKYFHPLWLHTWLPWTPVIFLLASQDTQCFPLGPQLSFISSPCLAPFLATSVSLLEDLPNSSSWVVFLTWDKEMFLWVPLLVPVDSHSNHQVHRGTNAQPRTAQPMASTCALGVALRWTSIFILPCGPRMLNSSCFHFLGH